MEGARKGRNCGMEAKTARGGRETFEILTSRWFVWADKAEPLQGKLSFETWSFPFHNKERMEEGKEHEPWRGNEMNSNFCGVKKKKRTGTGPLSKSRYVREIQEQYNRKNKNPDQGYAIPGRKDHKSHGDNPVFLFYSTIFVF